LICRKCNVRKRVMVNDGKGCSTIGANCFSHFRSDLASFPRPELLCIGSSHAALSALRSYSSQRATRLLTCHSRSVTPTAMAGLMHSCQIPAYRKRMLLFRLFGCSRVGNSRFVT
jgi:hypothetical protein